MSAAPVASDRIVTTIVPNNSVDQFWLPLSAFDFAPNGKNGFYPNNCGIAAHWREFAKHGYLPKFDAVQTKFPYPADGSRAITDFSVGIVDGQTKILCMMSLVLFIKELELTHEQIQDPHLQHVLGSFQSIRCSYQHFENPSQHSLESLRLGFVTEEKIQPSPLAITGDISQAINIERRMSRTRTALKDVLNRVVADFNRLTTVKKHRIDAGRKSLIYNLLRCPSEFLNALHAHYDQCKHSESALPHEILQHDFFVPGVTTRMEQPQYNGNGRDTFQEDFDKRAGKEATLKSKVRGKSVEEFLTAHQDRARSALQKSLEAAYSAWVEQLKSDQTQFESEKILHLDLIERFGFDFKDAHVRAWKVVKEFMDSSMTIFASRAMEADSTIMPSARAWIREVSAEVGCSAADHMVVLFLNLPAVGIVSSVKLDFFVSFLANTLADYKQNGIAILVHPNRAGQSAQRKQLSLKERNLALRPLTWVFNPDSVYGKRDGALTGLALIYNQKGNLFRQTTAWKTGVVHNITMLPRNQMWKPSVSPAKNQLPHLGRAFTDIQELKQVAGGSDFVRKTLTAFSYPTSKHTILVDCHGYDGWPCLSALEEIADKKEMHCATLMLDQSGAEIQSRVSNQLYEWCRNDKIQLGNFPNFGPLIAALREGANPSSTKSYRVCTQQGTRLLILESLASKWTETECTKDRATSEITAHNELYNKDGDFWFADEAREVMNEPDGRWFSFNVDGNTLILLEKKDLPTHLASMNCADSVIALSNVLREMEDQGEVKLEISHHTEKDGTITNVKPLVFLMDMLKDKKGKGAKESNSGITTKNFGARANVSVFKNTKNLSLAWRCRLFSSHWHVMWSCCACTLPYITCWCVL
ncbi:unnamed protein product [Durusdinium trenchii]|uniref:Uncharacterized protein n=1 Tax=Durusdinium trenchii TaxID=1381693 RepID=A0ABP0HXW8_9DINO